MISGKHCSNNCKRSEPSGATKAAEVADAREAGVAGGAHSDSRLAKNLKRN
jgi:hypothetical protein